MDFFVRILLSSSEWPLQISENSGCVLYVGDSLTIIKHHCSLQFKPTYIDALIDELYSKFGKGDKLRLVINGI